MSQFLTEVFVQIARGRSTLIIKSSKISSPFLQLDKSAIAIIHDPTVTTLQPCTGHKATAVIE